MTKTEIQEFKRFLHVRNIYLMFSQNYRQNRLSVNPPTLEAYLEKAKVENVIPQAFVYPKSIFGKDFWLAIHEEWLERIREQADNGEASQLANHLIELLGLDPEREYFQLGIELLAETKDYLLFMLRKK